MRLRLKMLKIILGGGILGIALLSANLNATELNTICTSNSCTLPSNYADITNHTNLSSTLDLSNHTITNLTNYATMGHIAWGGGNIINLTNYGTMGTITGIRSNNPPADMIITNYGTMGRIETQYGNKDIIIRNYGIINSSGSNIHFWGTSSNQYYFVLEAYSMIISENASDFANNSGNASNNNNSHIVVHGQGLLRFKDANSKIILDFGDNFELGKAYLLDKLIITQGSGDTRLKVDFDRLTTRSSLYKLTQSGNNFIVTIDTANSEMGTLYKSNIRTMNNFSTISESLIYPHKYKGVNRGSRKRVIRRIRKTAGLFDNSLDSFESNESFEYSPSLAEGDKGGGFNTQNNSSAQFSNNKSTNPLAPSAREGEVWDSFSTRYGESILLLKQNESFAYKSDSLFIADSQSEQRIKRMRNSTQNLNTRSANPNQSQSTSTNRTISSNQNYYFVLTPFVNHNLFFESGRYNLSGLEYGFVTAFSGKLNNSNSLGTHFVFSYGSLNDKDDSIFNITSMNLNLGLNYKLDLIYAMYLKARIDGYYFMNNITLNEISKIKPNNIGFGASVSYGKDFNFGNGGILGVYGGLDYKGLYGNAITFANANDSSINEQYSNSLQNLLYVDIGVDYNKYFKSSVGLWGLNVIAGIKGNTLFMLKSGNVSVKNRVFDMIIDNDKVLGYANISGSYVLNTKDFDMEFSIAYYGNFGDRVMSNGGGFEWRVYW